MAVNACTAVLAESVVQDLTDGLFWNGTTMSSSGFEEFCGGPFWVCIRVIELYLRVSSLTSLFTLLQSTYGLNLIVPTLLVVLRLPNSKKNNATLHIKVPPITHPFEENNVVLDIKYLSF